MSNTEQLGFNFEQNFENSFDKTEDIQDSEARATELNVDANVDFSAISDAEAKKRIDALRKEIEHHTYLYYAQDKPSISDYAYDSLMRSLRRLEEAFPQFKDMSSPTMRVGGYVGEQFSAVEHQVKMYSLDKCDGFGRT